MKIQRPLKYSNTTVRHNQPWQSSSTKHIGREFVKGTFNFTGWPLGIQEKKQDCPAQITRVGRYGWGAVTFGSLFTTTVMIDCSLFPDTSIGIVRDQAVIAVES